MSLISSIKSYIINKRHEYRHNPYLKFYNSTRFYLVFCMLYIAYIILGNHVIQHLFPSIIWPIFVSLASALQAAAWTFILKSLTDIVWFIPYLFITSFIDGIKALYKKIFKETISLAQEINLPHIAPELDASLQYIVPSQLDLKYLRGLKILFAEYNYMLVIEINSQPITQAQLLEQIIIFIQNVGQAQFILDIESILQNINYKPYNPTNPTTLHLKRVFENNNSLLVSSDHPCYELMDPVTHAFIDRPVVLPNDPNHFWERVSLFSNPLRASNGYRTNPITFQPYRLRDMQDAKALYSTRATQIIQARCSQIQSQTTEAINTTINVKIKKALYAAYQTGGARGFYNETDRFKNNTHTCSSQEIIDQVSTELKDNLVRCDLDLEQIVRSHAFPVYGIVELSKLIMPKIKWEATRHTTSGEEKKAKMLEIDNEFAKAALSYFSRTRNATVVAQSSLDISQQPGAEYIRQARIARFGK